MDQETLQQLAELLAVNNEAIFARIDGVEKSVQQLRTDVQQDMQGLRTDMEQLRTDVQQDMQQLRTDMQQHRAETQDMLHDQTESITQMTQRMLDAARPEIAAEVIRHMEVLLENKQDKKVQALYEDHEDLKRRVEKLERAANG